MKYRSLAAIGALMASPLLPGPVAAAAETLEGRCERLIIADADLTAECGTPVIQLAYDDARVAVSAGTGGQDWFGLADPEQVVLFIGTGAAGDWADHAVDEIVVHDNLTGTNVAVQPATGTCTYRDVDPGLSVSCDAEDAGGRNYALTYRTDGRPGFSF